MEQGVHVPGEMNRGDHGSPIAAQVTNVLLDQVGDIASRCGASSIFVSMEALGDVQHLRRMAARCSPGSCPIVHVLGGDVREMPEDMRVDATVLRLPDVPLTRMSQVKVATFLALNQGLITVGDVIVFITGQAGSGSLDTVIVMEIGRESELFHFLANARRVPSGVQPEVAARAIDIATELGAEGREGRPVGAIFVIGDTERVLAMSRQLILNPFHGYAAEHRNILDPSMEETIKEFSAIDGAFLIRGDGVLEACGVYLKTTTGHNLPRGLGTRHHVAAGITAVTDSLAIAVSQSTGTVTLFRDGRILTEIIRSRWLGKRDSFTPQVDQED